MTTREMARNARIATCSSRNTLVDMFDWVVGLVNYAMVFDLI
jgi:hypothetical protein